MVFLHHFVTTIKGLLSAEHEIDNTGKKEVGSSRNPYLATFFEETSAGQLVQCFLCWCPLRLVCVLRSQEICQWTWSQLLLMMSEKGQWEAKLELLTCTSERDQVNSILCKCIFFSVGLLPESSFHKTYSENDLAGTVEPGHWC